MKTTINTSFAAQITNLVRAARKAAQDEKKAQVVYEEATAAWRASWCSWAAAEARAFEAEKAAAKEAAWEAYMAAREAADRANKALGVLIEEAPWGQHGAHFVTRHSHWPHGTGHSSVLWTNGRRVYPDLQGRTRGGPDLMDPGLAEAEFQAARAGRRAAAALYSLARPAAARAVVSAGLVSELRAMVAGDEGAEASLMTVFAYATTGQMGGWLTLWGPSGDGPSVSARGVLAYIEANPEISAAVRACARIDEFEDKAEALGY